MMLCDSITTKSSEHNGCRLKLSTAHGGVSVLFQIDAQDPSYLNHFLAEETYRSQTL